MAWWSRNPKVHRRFSIKTFLVRRYKSTYRLREAIKRWLWEVSVVSAGIVGAAALVVALYTGYLWYAIYVS